MVNQLAKLLTLKRIGLRQSHAISAVKQRKNGFEAFKFNRKNWSNARGQKRQGHHGHIWTTSVIADNSLKSTQVINAPNSINIFQSDLNGFGDKEPSIQQ
jgi:hypothetical protein